ncbi:prepilin peptidase [Lacrimispora sp. 210928-DFI.3.58]|uniref:prepilin peptidase n=1 Tax=Lacrimispora sp. 210928-DFI.3.58 TaxID=2883214 RepID=UPI0015B5A11F|nr:prepilin peptidase [Lacrimispora sp. 210928-DFI.3.58]MCB7318138.1 prepilin peptidase [Lacrimispora sp. 210928-DFI.3.58]
MDHINEWILKGSFLWFSAAAAWQDARKRSISVRTFQIAGMAGIAVRMWEVCWKGEELMAVMAEGALALLPGIFLLLLSAVTEEAIGKGDGWFFLISGIYLGYPGNLLLLGGSLLLCFPVSLYLFLKGVREGRRTGAVRLPFLPFVFPVGIGVMLL